MTAIDVPTRGAIVVALSLLTGALGCSSSTGASRPANPAASASSHRTVRGPGGERHLVVGEASWYGPKFHGQQAASGEIFDMHEDTAAHRSLPFDTMVRVTERRTLKSVVVRITDRGPYVDGRVIDLAKRPAKAIGLVRAGVSPVRLEIVRWGNDPSAARSRKGAGDGERPAVRAGGIGPEVAGSGSAPRARRGRP